MESTHAGAVLEEKGSHSKKLEKDHNPLQGRDPTTEQQEEEVATEVKSYDLTAMSIPQPPP